MEGPQSQSNTEVIHLIVWAGPDHRANENMKPKKRIARVSRTQVHSAFSTELKCPRAHHFATWHCVEMTAGVVHWVGS